MGLLLSWTISDVPEHVTNSCNFLCPLVFWVAVKLVKLKEAQDEARAIPIVAFIARQRDLSSLQPCSQSDATRQAPRRGRALGQAGI